jgi:hypothetical protein
MFSELYVHWDESCLNPSQDTEHELCCHNSAEKPIQRLLKLALQVKDCASLNIFVCVKG